MTPIPQETYDCLILSGGGAKGSFGAGAAHAIHAIRKLKGITRPICYVGTSAGALNAAVLACSDDAEELLRFWQETSNRSVLGCRWKLPRVRAALHICHRPFSIYSNRALRHLISQRVKFDSIKHPLIVAATDYTNGRLTAFFVHSLLSELVETNIKEAQASGGTWKARLRRWRQIDGQASLENALLASSAIPEFFPPVKISVKKRSDENFVPEPAWFIDGGIGNHTPTPDAAICLKEIRRQKRGNVGDVYCVKQDPPSLVTTKELKYSFLDILKRTFEVYHSIHTDNIVNGWTRISREIQEHDERVEKFKQFVSGLNLSLPTRDELFAKTDELLGSSGGKPERFDDKLIEIQPSVTLGDSLDFNPTQMRSNILHGYNMGIVALNNMLTPEERSHLLSNPPLKQL